jgi:hypothetical protein
MVLSTAASAQKGRHFFELLLKGINVFCTLSELAIPGAPDFTFRLQPLTVTYLSLVVYFSANMFFGFYVNFRPENLLSGFQEEHE